MKCPWKNDSGCLNKCVMKIVFFVLAALGLSVLIKLISCFLGLFSYDHTLNTAIVIVSVIIASIGYSKCCQKSKDECCDIEEKPQPETHVQAKPKPKPRAKPKTQIKPESDNS
jgi:hypothetical protein